MSEAPMPPDERSTALLAALKDIDLLGPISWWPPAPGWWGLAALFLLGLFFLWRILAARRRRSQFRRDALLEIELRRAERVSDADDAAYANAMRQLIRRVAIHVAGPQAIARLTGRAFIDSVNELSSHALSNESARVLVESSYRPNFSLDPDSLQVEVEAWLLGLDGCKRV
jgi:hypothetical protein